MYRTTTAIITMCTMLQSCNNSATQEPSHLKITAGEEMSDNNTPAVIKLNARKGFTNYICTGTFIYRDVILTAGHCVAEMDEVSIGSGPAKGMIPSSIHIHPKYDNGNWDRTYRYDLAVLQFNSEVSHSMIPISSVKGKANDLARIIGYGNNNTVDRTGSGVKRQGFTIIDEVKKGVLFSNGADGTSQADVFDGVSLAGGGDSGGPMILSKRDHPAFLIGVTTGGRAGRSIWVDLHSRSSKSFLNSLSIYY